MSEQIIIIGGGIAGLYAAKKLSAEKKHVILLEARDRLGGRIHTIISNNGASIEMEYGAEFVHGELPITLGLLKEYGISYYKTTGEMYDLTKTKSSEHDDAKWNSLLQAMVELKSDIALSDFLNKFFSGKKNNSLRNAAEKYASGFDLADPEIASSMALYREWSAESELQFRIEGGYKKLIDALHNDCLKMGCNIYTSSIVKEIEWSKNDVKIILSSGKSFTGNKALITIPAGVWQDGVANKGFIHFKPAITQKIDLFRHIGFGSVIKLFLVFKFPFWISQYENAAFFFTPNSIPTWWTQEPKKNNLLTGWLGGIEAKKWNKKSDDEILHAAIDSLASSFNQGITNLKEILISSKIINWENEIFTKGGYSFSALDTSNARMQLCDPIENTLFFAGEALHNGIMQGTVEAALHSAFDSLLKMIST